jgi:hypothetical protein
VIDYDKIVSLHNTQVQRLCMMIQDGSCLHEFTRQVRVRTRMFRNKKIRGNQ